MVGGDKRQHGCKRSERKTFCHVSDFGVLVGVFAAKTGLSRFNPKKYMRREVKVSKCASPFLRSPLS